MDIYENIQNWTESDLDTLPKSEDDQYEFKSSRVTPEQLSTKLGVAASAFWNTGGGIFVVGVDGTGKPDGGIPLHIGRQPLRDWVDQALQRVEPHGRYFVGIIKKSHPASLIEDDMAVLVVAFVESAVAPHMAPDYKYYIRAGAHSVSANHFLVESIRAYQRFRTPLLRGVLVFNEQKDEIIELKIATLTDSPAINVEITFDPLTPWLKYHEDSFPLIVPLIDRNIPFSMEISKFGLGQEIFGTEPISLKLHYQDILGRNFEETQIIDITRNIGPMRITDPDKASLKDVVRELRRLGSALESKPSRDKQNNSEK